MKFIFRDKKTTKDLEKGEAFVYGTSDLYYKSPTEIKESYSEEVWQNCLKCCNEIYDKVQKFSIFDKVHLPVIDEEPEKKIKKIIFDNKYKIPEENKNIYYNRIKEELKVYRVTNSLNYLLIVKDFIEYGKNNGYLFNYGRGSACSSLVAYLMDIHNIDPIKNNLFFKRFLNENRGIRMKVF